MSNEVRISGGIHAYLPIFLEKLEKPITDAKIIEVDDTTSIVRSSTATRQELSEALQALNMTVLPDANTTEQIEEEQHSTK